MVVASVVVVASVEFSESLVIIAASMDPILAEEAANESRWLLIFYLNVALLLFTTFYF